MRKYTSPLTNLKVASPCSQDWEAMIGNERKRYCGECKLNVYNLSGMSKIEAENLLDNADGRVCVKFYQRADGTVITQDCPVGWAKIKNRTKVLATAAFSLMLSLFSGVLFASFFGKPQNAGGQIEIPFSPSPMMGEIAVNPGSQPTATMGNVSVPPKENFTMGMPVKGQTMGKIAASKNSVSAAK